MRRVRDEGDHYAVDPDTTVAPGTLQAALRSAGAAVAATDEVLSGKATNAFCAVRPPGHHATRDQAMGFCFFNNVAVAARHALDVHGLQRVAIVDFDVHHGNGTEDIIANDERVLMVSFFQHPLYPYSGGAPLGANMINLPVPAYTRGPAVRELIEMMWMPRLEELQMIFIPPASTRTARTTWASSAWSRPTTNGSPSASRPADRHAQGRIVLSGGRLQPGRWRAAWPRICACWPRSDAASMENLRSLERVLAELTPQGALAELAMLAATLAVAFGLVWLLRGARPPVGRSIWLGARLYDGVLFPLAALGVGVIARWALKDLLPVGLLRLAVPILTSLVLIRLSVQVLRTAFPGSQLVRRLERTVSWLVWGGLVLWLTGALPLLMEEMEGVQWRIGGASVTLLMLLQGAVSAGAVLLLVLWLSATIEAQLLKGAVGTSISARKMAANATRAMLLLIGILVALTAVGIPIGALSAGWRHRRGHRLSLQKLAANYVSGFVILAERSLRIGDLVRVDTFEGHITDIKTRYTVIRSLGGRESIVPNEMLITQRVENLSLADPHVLITTTVQVAYGTDVEALMPELLAAARAVPRVLSDPGPGIHLSTFAADGLELTLLFWIADPHNGQGSVRSAVNLAVLRRIRELDVEIPFPQRVVHTLPPPAAAPVDQPGNSA